MSGVTASVRPHEFGCMPVRLIILLVSTGANYAVLQPTIAGVAAIRIRDGALISTGVSLGVAHLEHWFLFVPLLDPTCRPLAIRRANVLALHGYSCFFYRQFTPSKRLSTGLKRKKLLKREKREE